jgi:type I restriction enzyme S subunit
VSSWVETPLKHLVSEPIVNGLGEPGRRDDKSWPRYVRTTDIRDLWHLRDDTFASLPPGVAAEAMLARGDILMCAAGSVGRSLYYDGDELACFAGYLVRVRPRRDVNGRYIAYWTQSTHSWDQIAVGAVRSTIDNFSASRYRNMKIQVPDRPTQDAIVTQLDEQCARIDALIAEYQRVREMLDQRLADWTSQFVSGLLDDGARRAVDTPWIPSIPENWELRSLRRAGTGVTWASSSIHRRTSTAAATCLSFAGLMYVLTESSPRRPNG